MGPKAKRLVSDSDPLSAGAAVFLRLSKICSQPFGLLGFVLLPFGVVIVF